MRRQHEGSAVGAHWVLRVLRCISSSHTATGIFSTMLNPTVFTKCDAMLSHNTLSKDAPFPFAGDPQALPVIFFCQEMRQSLFTRLKFSMLTGVYLEYVSLVVSKNRSE